MVLSRRERVARIVIIATKIEGRWPGSKFRTHLEMKEDLMERLRSFDRRELKKTVKELALSWINPYLDSESLRVSITQEILDNPDITIKSLEKLSFLPR